jgi:outer membrane protein assembly factor BamE (lipoprotein component of BamABCDE complex)
MKRRRRNILIIAVIAFVGVVAAWALRPVGRGFDQAVWRDERQESARLEMADRIVARRMLDGKARSEVVAMLGEPPKTGYFSDWDFVYRLGMERGFISIDSEWLVVRFDANDRVSEYRIVRD